MQGHGIIPGPGERPARSSGCASKESDCGSQLLQQVDKIKSLHKAVPAEGIS